MKSNPYRITLIVLTVLGVGLGGIFILTAVSLQNGFGSEAAIASQYAIAVGCLQAAGVTFVAWLLLSGLRWQQTEGGMTMGEAAQAFRDGLAQRGE